jgi:hypothetical protein
VTEERQPQAKLNSNEPPGSYEAIRDSAPSEARTNWQSADREEHALGAFYENLRDSDVYSEQEKSRQAWAQYARTKASITEKKARAKEQLESSIRSANLQSLPFPASEGPVTSSMDKILASQNEASRIRARLERASSQAGPFRSSPTDLLREEYGNGLTVGGVLGGAICRGAISCAQDYGIELDPIVDEYRNDRQRRRLSDAERNREQLAYIGMRIPEPPFPRPAADKTRMAFGNRDQGGSEGEANSTGRKRLFASKPSGHVSRGRGGLPANATSPLPPPREETDLDKKRKNRSKNRNTK